jgi:hypothetical protein
VGDIVALVQQNASDLEWEWTLSCLAVLLFSLYRLVRFSVLWVRLKRRNGQYVHERRATLVRVVRNVERVYVLGVFTALGFIGMITPAPVRVENQQAAELFGNLFLSVAIARLIGTIVEETLEHTI